MLEGEEDELLELRAEVEALRATVDLLLKEVAALKEPRTAPVPAPPTPSPAPSRPSYREAAMSGTSRNPPSDGWTEVPRSKRSLKTSKQPVPVKTPSSKATPSSLKDSLGGLSAAEKLKVLLRSPRPDHDRTTMVDIVTVNLPLSKKAQAQPMVAWKQAVKEITGHQPLLVSLVHPCRAEVYVDSAVSMEVKERLRPQGYLEEDPPELEERDLVRRKRAYLSGYFLPLRRATLQGLDPTQQLQVLQMAEADLNPSKHPDQMTRKQWMFQIKKDRQWIEGFTME